MKYIFTFLRSFPPIKFSPHSSLFPATCLLHLRAFYAAASLHAVHPRVQITNTSLRMIYSWLFARLTASFGYSRRLLTPAWTLVSFRADKYQFRVGVVLRGNVTTKLPPFRAGFLFLQLDVIYLVKIFVYLQPVIYSLDFISFQRSVTPFKVDIRTRFYRVATERLKLLQTHVSLIFYYFILFFFKLFNLSMATL